MRFNYITPMTETDRVKAKEAAAKYGIEITDTKRGKREFNVWGQLEDIYMFNCKGSFEDMIRMKYATGTKFKMCNGVSLV